MVEGFHQLFRIFQKLPSLRAKVQPVREEAQERFLPLVALLQRRPAR